MSCIRCGGLKYTLAQHKYTPTPEKINTDMMSRNFPACQAEAMDQLYTSRVLPSIRHAQTNRADRDTEKTTKYPRNYPQ